MALLDRLNPVTRTRARSEALLRNSPRGFEFACAVLLAVLAVMILWSIAQYEWFLVAYRQFYQQMNRSERIDALTYEACEALFALWMMVLAANVARAGADRDRGLFGPMALRIWGAIFAALPVVAMIASQRIEFHMVSFFWTAAIACFTLASRRSKLAAARRAAPVRERASFGPPPPID